jgi:hypothetical protein
LVELKAQNSENSQLFMESSIQNTQTFNQSLMQASINSQGVGNRGAGGNNQYGMSLAGSNGAGMNQEKQPKITINLMDVSFLEQNLQ